MFRKNLYSVFSYIVELLDEDYMIHSIVGRRQIDKTGGLWSVWVNSWLMHYFPGLSPAWSLKRCSSTIGTI